MGKSRTGPFDRSRAGAIAFGITRDRRVARLSHEHETAQDAYAGLARASTFFLLRLPAKTPLPVSLEPLTPVPAVDFDGNGRATDPRCPASA